MSAWAVISRRIRQEMHVGQPRAQAIRDYLSALTRRQNVSTISPRRVKDQSESDTSAAGCL